jgi:hypothetical protein
LKEEELDCTVLRNDLGRSYGPVVVVMVVKVLGQ